jgi:hypothetical protein
MKGYFLSLTRFWTDIIAICFLFISFWEREFKQLARIEIHRDCGSETERDDDIQSERDDDFQLNWVFRKKRCRCVHIYIYIYIIRPGLIRVYPGRPGSGSTHRVSPGQFPGCFLLKPGPALDPGRPGPGSAGSRVDPPGRAGFQNYGCCCWNGCGH